MARPFDQAITLQASLVTIGDLGEEFLAWSTWLASCPARVIEGQGREYLKAGQMLAEERVVFVTRWLGSEATSRALQVQWAGRAWNVEQVTGTQRGGETWLHCRAVSGEN